MGTWQKINNNADITPVVNVIVSSSIMTDSINAINATNALNALYADNAPKYTLTASFEPFTSSMHYFTSSIYYPFSASVSAQLLDIEMHSGSWATTGSNVFRGDQTISGSVYVSRSISIGYIPTLGTPATTYLTTSGGVVQSRTNAQVLSDIGGEPVIVAGTTLQYWRGDKTWQTLNTSVVPEGTNLYYLDSRSRMAISSTATGLSYNTGSGVFSYASGYAIPQSGLLSARPVAGTVGRYYYATDNGIDYYDNGVAWVIMSGALSGDVSSPSGSLVTTLATVNTNVGTFGSATQSPVLTVNAKGLITAVSNATITPAASSITGGAALSKTDDTNVTVTLGGSYASALLAASSITLGWTGTLAVSRGGTGLGTLSNNYLYKGQGTLAMAQSLIYDDGTHVLIGTTTSNVAKQTIYSATKDTHLQLAGAAPSLRFNDAVTGGIYNGFVALASAANDYITGSVAGDLVIGNQNNGDIIFGFGPGVATEKFRIKSTGVIQSGTWQGSIIMPTYGGTGLNTSASTGVPSISSGTWSVNTTLPVSLGGTGLATTSQNYVFAGPTSGAGAPTWRLLVAGDIPSLSATYLPLAGGTMTGGILMSGGAAIDSVLTVGTDVLNIGTSNADTINIGWSGSTVNIQGTLLYQNVTNLAVTDKLITVNKGGAIASGASSGFEIEEAATITGYFATSAARTGWDFKAPASQQLTLSLASLTAARVLTMPDATGTILLDSRSLTINGSAQTLAADRTWTITTTGTANRISVTGGAGLTPTIDIAATYIGQTSITTLGTITTGTWTGTAIGDTWIASSASWNIAYGSRIQYGLLSALPLAGTVGRNYYATDNGVSYFDNGTAWVIKAGALTGDITTSANSLATTLATVNSNIGSFGNASSVATFTVNAKGLTTAAGSTAIQIAESQVTGLVTDLSNKQPLATNLTSLAALSYVSPSFVKMTAAGTFALDVNTYLTGNQSITWTASNDISGSASGTTAISPSLTVTGLRGVALPALSVGGGLLKYTGTTTNTWVFDTNTYLTGNQTITLSGDVSGSGTTAITTTIGTNAVTYAKFQQVAASSLVGNSTGVLANATGITLGAGLAFSAGTLVTSAIPNASLSNSAITINGNAVSLGGSTTVTATATNALTIGTDLSGTSYNGSAAVTINNTSTLATTTGRGNTTTTGISLTENGNLAASYALYGKRLTDVSPLGYLIQFQNAAATTNLFTVDVSGNVVGTLFSGSGASLTSIPNTALVNSSFTLGSTSIALGSTTTTVAGLTSVTSTTFVGALTGTASNASLLNSATNSTTSGSNTIVQRDGSGDIFIRNVNATAFVGTLSTASQPNITSVGTLTGLNVSGIGTFGTRTGGVPTYRGDIIINQTSSQINTNGGLELFSDGSGSGYGGRIQYKFDGSSNYGFSLQTRTNSATWTERFYLSEATGAITVGTWNASTIGVAYGGTGNTTLTSNYLYKGQGTSAMVASGISDDGTTVTLNSRAFSGINATWSDINVFTGTALGGATQRWIGTDGGTSGLFLNAPSAGHVYLGIANNNVIAVAATSVTLQQALSGTSATFNAGANDAILTTVNGAVLGLKITQSSATNDAIIRLQTNGHFYDVRAYANNSLGFDYDGSTRLSIASTGAATFSANDATGNRISPFNTLTITTTNPNLPYGGFGSGLVFASTHYNNTVYSGARIRNASYDNSLSTLGDGIVFDVTATRGGSLTEAMRIDNAGNVGIGTTSPSYKLDVNGTGNFSSSLTALTISVTQGVFNRSSSIGSASASGAMIVENLSSGNAVLDIGVDATSLGFIQSRNIANTTVYTLNLNPMGGTVALGGALSGTSATFSGNISLGGNTTLYSSGGATFNSIIKSTASETFRLVGTGGYLSGWNAAETVRTGYLQFNAGSSVIIAAENSAVLTLNSAAGIVLNNAVTANSSITSLSYITANGNLTTNGELYITPSTSTAIARSTWTNASGYVMMGVDNSTGSNVGVGNYGRFIYSSGAYPLTITSIGTLALSGTNFSVSTTGAANFYNQVQGYYFLGQSSSPYYRLTSTETSGRTWDIITAGTTSWGSGAGSLVFRNNSVDVLTLNGANTIATFTGAIYSPTGHFYPNLVAGNDDPYGAVSVTNATTYNYSYYGLTKSGIFGMGLGITTDNYFFIGATTGGGASSVLSGTAYLKMGSSNAIFANDVTLGSSGALRSSIGEGLVSYSANVNYYGSGNAAHSLAFFAGGSTKMTLNTGGGLAVYGETSSIGYAGTINANAVLQIGRGISGIENISGGAVGNYGLLVLPTFKSTASGQNQYGISASVYSIANGLAQTVASIKNIYVPASSAGVNVTVTNAYGIYIEAPTVGATNIGLYNAGTTTLAGALSGTSATFSSSVSAAASITSISTTDANIYINNTTATTGKNWKLNSNTDGTFNIGVNGVAFYQTFSATGAVSFTNSTASTSTTTGALVVSGGIGVAGAMYVGGYLTASGGAGTSDLRVKFIQEYNARPSVLDLLNLRKYNQIENIYLNTKYDDRVRWGFATEDVRKLYPELIFNLGSSTSPEALNYTDLHNMAIIELRDTKEDKSVVAKLEARIAELEHQLNLR